MNADGRRWGITNYQLRMTHTAIRRVRCGAHFLRTILFRAPGASLVTSHAVGPQACASGSDPPRRPWSAAALAETVAALAGITSALAETVTALAGPTSTLPDATATLASLSSALAWSVPAWAAVIDSLAGLNHSVEWLIHSLVTVAHSSHKMTHKPRSCGRGGGFGCFRPACDGQTGDSHHGGTESTEKSNSVSSVSPWCSLQGR